MYSNPLPLLIFFNYLYWEENFFTKLIFLFFSYSFFLSNFLIFDLTRKYFKVVKLLWSYNLCAPLILSQSNAPFPIIFVISYHFYDHKIHIVYDSLPINYSVINSHIIQLITIQYKTKTKFNKI